MINKLNADSFDTTVNTTSGPYLLKFGSTTCGPCQMMIPVLEKLSQTNPEFPIYDIDTNESPELASHFNIRSVPTMHFCEGRDIIMTLNGLTPFRDLEYIIENIDDPHLREYGEFKKVEKKDYFIPALVVGIILFILLLIFI
jgi:thioredoxin 1